MNRRIFLIAAILAFLGLALQPAGAADSRGEIALGKPTAKITIIEYYSMTCSHCAIFDIETLPKLRKEWIDSGKARFVFRDFPLDQLALRAAVLGRCLAAERGAETYARFVELLMKSQGEWARSKAPLQALEATARLAGMSKDSIDACIADKKLETFIMEGQLEAQQKYKLDSTPSFIINGKMFAGALPFEEFDKILKDQ